jgi:hypothetical protein
MAAQHVTAAEVQQFLDTTKLEVASVDQELEVTWSTYVLSNLGQAYNVSAWVDNTSTPQLVRSIIAMLIAAAIYQKAYSEATADAIPPYGDKLEVTANEMIVSLVEGDMHLLDAAPNIDELIEQPLYTPDDSTGSTSLYDAMGNQIGDEGSEDIKFRMGQMF